MPRSHSQLTCRIVTRENLERAFDEVVDKLPHRRRDYYRGRREKLLSHLAHCISTGSFRVRGYREMVVTDGPKQRLVQSPSVPDRIGCNAVMRVVEDAVYGSVVRTSAASIPGRGMHRLFQKVRRDVERDRAGTRYYYKCDIRKFYESIDQDQMCSCLRRYVRDRHLMGMLESFVRLMPHGLSIGLRSSQCFGNLLLSSVDHLLKDDLGVKYYYRYCDDIVILGSSKRELWRLRAAVKTGVGALGLEVKPDEAVRPLRSGLDFLGYVYDGSKALLRKRTKQKAARRLSRISSRRRRRELCGSLKGMALWGDCRHLYMTLTGREMETFAELKKRKQACGVNYKSKDGKRIISGRLVKLQSISNMHVTVTDFEADVSTQNGPRYVVQFKYEDGSLGKYLTNDSEQKFWLEELRRDGSLPFDCVIRPVWFGEGKVRYVFG